MKYFDYKSFKINKKPPVNKQRKQIKNNLVIYVSVKRNEGMKMS